MDDEFGCSFLYFFNFFYISHLPVSAKYSSTRYSIRSLPEFTQLWLLPSSSGPVWLAMSVCCLFDFATNDDECIASLRSCTAVVKHGFRWRFVAYVSTTEIHKWHASFDGGTPDAATAREIYPSFSSFSVRVRLLRGDIFHAGHA